MSEDQADREMTLTERIHLAGERLTATDEKDIMRLSAVISDLTSVIHDVVAGIVEENVKVPYDENGCRIDEVL